MKFMPAATIILAQKKSKKVVVFIIARELILDRSRVLEPKQQAQN
ncbi:MAG: hypothetical protein ACJAXM_000717 [Arenicella sp.]|jgi:hypothetical protein